MRDRAIGALLLTALLGACGGTVEEAFEVGPGGSLRAEVDFGDANNWDRGTLDVATHDEAGVKVEATTEGFGSWAVKLAAVKEGNDVIVRSRTNGPLYRWFGGPKLRLSVLVPEGYGVDVRTTGGRMRLHDLRGVVRANSEDDDIRIAGATGPVDVNSGRGKVFVKDVLGDAKVSTSRSNISIENVGGSVEAVSESGAILIDTAAGSASARTERGTIEMSNIGAAVKASTDTGNIDLIDIAGPLEATSKRGRVTARFTGDPAGKVETDVGGITVRLPSSAKLELDAKTRRGTLRLDGVFWLEGSLAQRAGTGTINGGGELLLLRSGAGTIDVDSR